jgi:Kyakuja-Dileera-Zisupton transposase
VNFHKGEKWVFHRPLSLWVFISIDFRQMNMDYCLSEAMKFNMDRVNRSILLYDIMCQYWKNIKKRFDGNPYLTFPEGVEVLRGIGLFHVHGHKDECYARFAPTFIPGAGMVDGEVLETLWAVLNGIADSIRSQSSAHRQETLDDHMNDSNWKKLIHLIFRLCQKFKTAVESAKASHIDFQHINDGADPEVAKKWSEEEEKAQSIRHQREEAMDIFDLMISKGEWS